MLTFSGTPPKKNWKQHPNQDKVDRVEWDQGHGTRDMGQGTWDQGHGTGTWDQDRVPCDAKSM